MAWWTGDMRTCSCILCVLWGWLQVTYQTCLLHHVSRHDPVALSLTTVCWAQVQDPSGAYTSVAPGGDGAVESSIVIKHVLTVHQGHGWG